MVWARSGQQAWNTLPVRLICCAISEFYHNKLFHKLFLDKMPREAYLFFVKTHLLSHNTFFNT